MTQVTTAPVQNAPAPKTNIMQVLQQTPATSLASLPMLEERFINLYSKVQGVGLQHAEMAFHAEKFHFQKAISENAGLRECETLSLYGCFMDCAVQGLSFDPKKKLAYLIPGSVNIGTKDAKQYVKRASLEISPYGEMAIRQQLGQIKYADNPVIVYEGDVFEPYENSEGKGVTYKLNPAHTETIIAAFIRIVRVDGSVDYHWLLKNDWTRLAGYSEKKNFGKANALYTSNGGQIDTGFLGAKMIKHAFKTYPKVNVVGQFSKIAEIEEVKPNLSAADIYGADIAKELPAPPANLPHPTMIVTPVDNGEVSHEAKAAMLQATADAPEMNGTVQYSDDNAEGF